ncbi:MAG: AI-2E family transporter [Saprospiraceae bacterium]|nr:AI-2E family transporter [Saprospiraceae bacterium]
MSESSSLYPGKSRQFVVISIIFILFLFLLLSLNAFINAFLGALIFYVLFRNFMRTLIKVYNWRRWLAATLIIFISFLVIIIPIFGLLYLLIGRVQNLLNDPQDVVLGYNTLIAKLNGIFDQEIINGNMIGDYFRTWAAGVPSVLSSSLLLFGSLLMMYFLLYYLLVNIGRVEPALFRYLPFTKEGIHVLTNELRDMTKANAIAVPLIAFGQGIVASFGFWLFGLNDPLFWGIMCGCTSILPVVGAGLIWFPAGIFMLSTSVSWQGIGILLYGALVISTVDNIFRLFFARWFADVHPVITILGVIIGLKWFGLPGLVFGPLLISYFFLLIKIYRKEFVA